MEPGVQIKLLTPTGLRAFWQRLAVLPFEVLIGQLVVITGILALLHVGGVGQDALSIQLPDWLNVTIDVIYALSGIGVLLGVGFGAAGVESFGLLGVIGGVIIRAIGLVSLTRLRSEVVVLLVFDVLVVVACGVRIAQVLRGRMIIQTPPGGLGTGLRTEEP